MSADLLLEIGCENLPPAAIRPAFEQLERDAAARLAELRLDHDAIYTTGTPRRLVLIVRGLADAQRSEIETITGPPVSKAFDESGKPTSAAEGFARSQGLAVGKLKTIRTDRGEYVGFTRRMKSRRAALLLRELLPELIAGLKFPKVMCWEESELRFARPIRWIAALLGGKVVRFKIGGVTSGNASWTVPWIWRKRVVVRSAQTYEATMQRAGVILDHERRRAVLERLAHKAADKEGLRLIEDPGLFEQLTFMLEDPRSLLGGFDRKYLQLPAPVVVTAMKAHQRYFALSKKGKRASALVPHFLTFTEGRVGAPSVVRHGNEKVLKARLEDALFYWQEDLKTGMDGLAGKLASIVFIEGLGTLDHKSARVRDLALAVHELGDDREVTVDTVRRAAHLAKADLASEMIKDGKEFTLLQGLIGSCYAAESGEAAEVVAAIREQYMPRAPGDALPKSALGALIGIADRLDTITGCFLAGFIPSGSQDPYALRRQANGLLRLLEGRPHVSLGPLLDQAILAYSTEEVSGDVEAVRALLVDFMKSRVATFLKDKGIAYDAVAAVSAVAWARPSLALRRAESIEALRGDEAFELLITGAKRVGNILADDKKVYGVDLDTLREAFAGGSAAPTVMRFDTSAFVDEAERALHRAVAETLRSVAEKEATGDGTKTLRALSGLGPAIDRYFDEVLVNTPETPLRDNRHGFLAGVFALFSKYADFSHIVEEARASVG